MGKWSKFLYPEWTVEWASGLHVFYSKNHIHGKCPWNVTVYLFFFQSGVSLNRKQQQQLVCSDEVRLEFFYKNSLSWWVILDVRTKSKCSRFSEFNNKTFLSDTAWPFYSDVDLKSDFDSNAEPLNFQAKFIDYYSVIWSSFLGTVVHTTIMGS